MDLENLEVHSSRPKGHPRRPRGACVLDDLEVNPIGPDRCILEYLEVHPRGHRGAS